MQHLRREQAELAVAEHDAVAARLDAHLLEDLEGRGERLREDGDLVGHAGRHRVQVRDRHAHELGEGAVRAQDAHHVARRDSGGRGRACTRRSGRSAKLISPTTRSPTSAAGPCATVPDELVAEHAAEAHVALHQLEVGVADTGERHAHERALGVQLGTRDLLDGGPGSIEVQRTHAALGVRVRLRRHVRKPAIAAASASGWSISARWPASAISRTSTQPPSAEAKLLA